MMSMLVLKLRLLPIYGLKNNGVVDSIAVDFDSKVQVITLENYHCCCCFHHACVVVEVIVFLRLNYYSLFVLTRSVLHLHKYEIPW